MDSRYRRWRREIVERVAKLNLRPEREAEIESMLFGVTRLDPVVYVSAVGTLVVVVALACIAPALRALRVQPVEVLRAE